MLWLIYLALEPYVRRFWPDGILGWTRLMSGYVRDPRVGRDVLIGCVFGACVTVAELLYNLLPPMFGRASSVPRFQSSVNALTGVAALGNVLFDQVIGGIFVAMFAALGYVLLRLALRRTSFAVAAAAILLSLVQAQNVIQSAAPVWMSVAYSS